MSHWPRWPDLYATRSNGLSRRSAHHCRPVKLSSSGPDLRRAECEDARIQTQRQLSPGGSVCVCDGAGDYLSPFNAATWARGRDPTKTDVQVNQRDSVAISWRFLIAMNYFSDNALNAEFFYFCNKEKIILNKGHQRWNCAKMLNMKISGLWM